MSEADLDKAFEGLPSLRALTSARVALARTGNSLATSEVLNFQLAHAQARDAVQTPLDLPTFAQRLAVELAAVAGPLAILQLRSQAGLRANARAEYLRHPHLGRTLAPESVALLEASYFNASRVPEAGHGAPELQSPDLAIVIADGLSALAVERNVIPLLACLLPMLHDAHWRLAPLTLVAQGRVAVADEVGSLLRARCTLMLLGERPGLSAADSLGAYITWATGLPTLTDAERNCVSNIRAEGLAPEAAAHRIFWYLEAARREQRTGTLLKDASGLALLS